MGRVAGRGAGVHQSAKATHQGRELVHLELQMSMDAPNPRDHVVLDSDPPVDVLVQGGYHGDRGTVGTALSGIRRVMLARPGLMSAAG